MYRNKNGKEVHYEICDSCKNRIYGKTYFIKSPKDSYDIIIIIAKKKIKGVCVGSYWMDYFKCLDCFRENK